MNFMTGYSVAGAAVSMLSIEWRIECTYDYHYFLSAVEQRCMQQEVELIVIVK
jgi:5-formaminoimidazole-4-carboxamide-1-beta-D-ribofuranosyl 5'-monophosphate synthetase